MPILSQVFLVTFLNILFSGITGYFFSSWMTAYMAAVVFCGVVIAGYAKSITEKESLIVLNESFLSQSIQRTTHLEGELHDAHARIARLETQRKSEPS